MIISTSMRSPFELSGESLGQHMALFNIWLCWYNDIKQSPNCNHMTQRILRKMLWLWLNWNKSSSMLKHCFIIELERNEFTVIVCTWGFIILWQHPNSAEIILELFACADSLFHENILIQLRLYWKTQVLPMISISELFYHLHKYGLCSTGKNVEILKI